MNNYLGKPENYDKEKIKNLLETRKLSSIANLEKAIFALEYIAQLKEEGFDFIFKGGSAIQILLGDQWNRLSVDADICTNASKDELDSALDSIKSRFNGVDFSYAPRESDLDNFFASYRISTPPITDTARTILLDVQLITPKYSVQDTKLESFFYKTDKMVQTPTVNSILGDKLSVIGPTTVGRKLDDSRNGIEYAKHFYDINSLHKNLSNFEETRVTYSSIIKIQEKIRRKTFQLDHCINDAQFTCQVASLPQGLGTKLIEESSIDKDRASLEFEKLQTGLRQFGSFIVNKMPYAWDILRDYSANTALLLELVRKNCSNKQALSILETDFVKKRGVPSILKRIEDVDKENRWFIDLEEITVFPQIMEKWYKLYYIDELIENESI